MKSYSPLRMHLQHLPSFVTSPQLSSTCSSSMTITRPEMNKMVKKASPEQNLRPKLYKSSNKLQKMGSLNQPHTPKASNDKANSSLTFSMAEYKIPEKFTNKSKLSNIKEHDIDNNMNFPSPLKMLKQASKVPKFLNKSQEKVKSQTETFTPMTPQPKLLSNNSHFPNAEDWQIKKSTCSKNQKLVRIKIKGRIQFFKIIKFLDQGSYGKVHLVQHTRSGFILCLKTLQKSCISSQMIPQLFRQIHIQSCLSHPNMVHLYGFSSDTKYIYLLLEPCLDGTLFNSIRNTPLDEKIARKYLKQLCSCLQYLHRMDVIHRDIKPQNILFHQGNVKLCDFGWAVHTQLMRTTKCGTPIYTCPQMVKDQSYDNKLDVWCIGVLTYEMIMADIPFEINTPQDLFKIVEEEVPFAQNIKISPQAKDFIMKCMEKDSKKRLNIRQAREHPFLKSRERVATVNK